MHTYGATFKNNTSELRSPTIEFKIIYIPEIVKTIVKQKGLL